MGKRKYSRYTRKCKPIDPFSNINSNKHKDNFKATSKRISTVPDFLNIGVISQVIKKPNKAASSAFINEENERSDTNNSNSESNTTCPSLRRSLRLSRKRTKEAISQTSDTSLNDPNQEQPQQTPFKENIPTTSNSKSLFREILAASKGIFKQSDKTDKVYSSKFITADIKTTNIHSEINDCFNLNIVSKLQIKNNTLETLKGEIHDEIKSINNILTGKTELPLKPINEEIKCANNDKEITNVNPIQFVSKEKWKYSTPVNQKVKYVELPQTNIRPAIIQEGSQKNTIYEFSRDFDVQQIDSNVENIDDRYIKRTGVFTKDKRIILKEKTPKHFYGRRILSEPNTTSQNNVFNFKASRNDPLYDILTCSSQPKSASRPRDAQCPMKYKSRFRSSQHNVCENFNAFLYEDCNNRRNSEIRFNFFK